MSNPILTEFIQEEIDNERQFKNMNIFQALFGLICLIGMVLILIEAISLNFG